MPYVVPTSGSGTAVLSPSSPASPNKPGSSFSQSTSSSSVPFSLSLSLSITRAPPAPVPGPTSSPRSGSGYLYPPPPLVKSHSESNTTTHRISWPSTVGDFMQAAAAARGQYVPGPSSSSSTSSSSSSLLISAAAATSHVRSSPPLIRRAASESASGSPPRSTDAATRLRFANTAGRGLIHIPRRDRTRSGANHQQHSRTASETEIDKQSMGDAAATTVGAGVEGTKENTTPHVRGRRGRLNFVLGSGESSDEHEQEEGKDQVEGGRGGNGKEEGERSVETCAARKRPVSAERSRALNLKKQIVFDEGDGAGSVREAKGNPDVGTERGVDEEGSGSECATPTPRSVARGQRVRARVVGDNEDEEEQVQLTTSASDTNIKNVDLEKNTPQTVSAQSPSVRIRRGRGRRRSMFDDEDFEEDETSTVAFPKSEPPSPPRGTEAALALPQVAVTAPSPQTSPQPEHADSSATLGQKRGVGSLHIEIAPNASSTANGQGVSTRRFVNYAAPQMPVTAPATLVAMPTVSHSASDTSGMLSASGSSSATSTTGNGMPHIIRKKSGEVVKSALRRSSSVPRPEGMGRIPGQSMSMSDIAGLSSANMSPSLSAPSSPRMGLVDMRTSSMGSMDAMGMSASASVPKMVHFGLKIEEVRLFNKESKPAAVSRGSSPTAGGSGRRVGFGLGLSASDGEGEGEGENTTSGGESEDGGSGNGNGSAGFGGGGGGGGVGGGFGFRALQRKRRGSTPGASMSEEEDAVRRALTMRVLNMPQRDPWVVQCQTRSTVNAALTNSGQPNGISTNIHTSTNNAPKQGNAQLKDSDSESIPDVLLENLHLSPDASSVDGMVRVKNIAFEKNVAVRFTFDGWQTTSEVLARWVESVPTRPSPGVLPRVDTGVSAPLPSMTSTSPPMSAFEGGFATSFYSSSVPNLSTSNTSMVTTNDTTAAGSSHMYDRFAFTIRLADMLLRIEEKTLVLAVRYRAAGREVWDNNGGENYKAVFERRTVAVVEGREAGLGMKKVGSGSDDGNDDDIKLKSKYMLDDVKNGIANNKNSKAGNPTANSVGTIDRDRSLEALVSPTKKPRALSGSGSLASRYDLGASLRDKTPFSRPTVESFSFQPFEFPGSKSFGHGHASADITRSHAHNAAARGHAHGRGKDKSFAAHTVVFPTRGFQQLASRGSPRDFGSAEAEAARDDVLALVQKRSMGMGLGSEDGAGAGAYRLGYYQQTYSPRSSTRPTRPRAHFRSHTGMTGYFDGVPFGSNSESSLSPSSIGAVGTGTGSVSPAFVRAAGFGATQARLTPPGSPGAMGMGLLQPPNLVGDHQEYGHTGMGFGKGHRALSFDSAGLSLSASSSSPTTPSCEATPRAGYGAGVAANGTETEARTVTSPTPKPSIASWNAGGHFWAGGLGIAVPSSAINVGTGSASVPSAQTAGISALDSPSEVSTPSSMATASVGTSPTMTSPASPPDYEYGPMGAMKMRESVSLDSAAYGALFHRICRYTGPDGIAISSPSADPALMALDLAPPPPPPSSSASEGGAFYGAYGGFGNYASYNGYTGYPGYGYGYGHGHNFAYGYGVHSFGGPGMGIESMRKGSPRPGSTPTMVSVGAFEHELMRGHPSRESPSSSAGTVTPTAAHFAASAASVRG